MKLKGLKAIDLFSGAGGFSLSAANMGVDVIAAIEFDKDACDTYRNNLIGKNEQKTQILHGDILEISPAELLSTLGLEEGQLDLLIGGPPCQGFSSHRINDAGVDDPRNRLLIRYFDFVKAFLPKVFLVENVPGLLWKRHELYLQKFKNLSHENGYTLLGPVKINAKDFGVPQNRTRVFMMGIHTDIDPQAVAWPPKPTHFSPDVGKPTWNNASTVFETPPNISLDKLSKKIGEQLTKALIFGQSTGAIEDDRSALHMNHTPALIERFSQTPINGSRTDIEFRLPCHAGDYVGHKDVYGRIRLAQPAPTITTGCFNPSKGRFLHPWKNHGITVRHAARLQTFPDNFVFSGGITSQGKQVGNAVPIILGEVMIKAAVECIVRFFDRQQKTA